MKAAHDSLYNVAMLSDNLANSVALAEPLNTVARPRSLADGAHRQLLSQLDSAVWRAGDKLPPEKALAESLGVSRPVVREALARLKADGRIESKQGSGAFVAERNKIAAFRFAQTHSNATPSADNMAELEMLELRQMVESGVAELAAVRRTTDDIRAIADALARMDAALAHQSDGSAADDAFHHAIAAATHNSQLSKFVEFLGAQFSASRKTTWDQAGYGVGITEIGQVDHRAMLAAIASAQPTKARRLAHAHVQRAIDRVKLRDDAQNLQPSLQP
jgi:GntR family transcriptional regulator, transcriptional repressor for pyruvate dehydrogenase complex